jgi:5'-nucleotidase (lipoprotein e(P4) family)
VVDLVPPAFCLHFQESAILYLKRHHIQGGAMKRGTMFFAVLLALAFCMPGGTASAARIKLSNDIVWVKSSDAYKCCVQQAYCNAEKRMRDLSNGAKPGTWCVVLDADETIISNVEFQESLQIKGTVFSSEAWTEWCNKCKAPALPGAREFCAAVKKCGGKVIIITNRGDRVKQATLKNLNALGFDYDACIFRGGPYKGDRSKAERRADVEKGALKTLPAGTHLPALKILMLVGDQTHDLYGSESFNDVKERFGRDLVIIPNPMYGDWYKDAYVEAASTPRSAKSKQ